MITKIQFMNAGRLYIAAGCQDGTLIFFFKPILDIFKETQPEATPDQSEIKRGHHTDEITCIANTEEFIAFGSSDNTVTVWKAMT